jgi:hypothetical protein
VNRLPASLGGHVLALDLATTTGWCGGAFGARPRQGTIHLKGDRAIERCAALREWLDDYEAVSGRVTALVLEATILTGRDTPELAELLWGLRVTALMWAYDGSMPPHAVVSYPSQSVRAHMLGSGRFPKGEAKDAVLAWCRRAGFDTASHDAADAILTWSFAEALTMGKPAAPRPGLLTAGRGA